MPWASMLSPEAVAHLFAHAQVEARLLPVEHGFPDDARKLSMALPYLSSYVPQIVFDMALGSRSWLATLKLIGECPDEPFGSTTYGWALFLSTFHLALSPHMRQLLITLARCEAGV
ncbi:hypothetical protein ALO95_102384 [Pseudomonas syringae pv. antirrhini]|uniref:Uncharacterized protein n=1 Tax=Pseudomonas syringae pv. antirrhini TaxID=251702 RepID=A0A0N8QM20_9PSED|nr:hypothetical protein ALO88_102824 [Pseudomonas syringae pv. antirrhini]RMP28918.1 hypothetical protein ALQ24_102919 [Pseudomonas syringae pv. antirrhini]RMP35252.1 hypothetical protein ALQ23_102590 [Pseudomonas syringae pv. antirrhini]RMW22889.1 hypothetical protein ALO95_102384 [Pseudomonas syringae pv. antirrhini]